MSLSSKLVRRLGKTGRFGSHRDLESYRDLVIVLVQKELKVRYNNKILGYFWSIANPLASAFIYYMVFNLFMKVQIEDYALVLLSGVFPWQWFTNSVGSAPNLFVGNASIIKKVSFPRDIIPLCMVLNHMIHYIASLPVILLFVYIFHHQPTVQWIYGIPILLAIHFLMVYGISLILASINLFFRDMERLIGILLNFVFYITPILYPIDVIPKRFRMFMTLNPASPLIVSWRELFLYGRLEINYLLISLAWAILLFILGYFVYRKLSWKFAEVI
jgi:lipopolysaccharide transport system permease protein